jgi:hypothetical protein
MGRRRRLRHINENYDPRDGFAIRGKFRCFSMRSPKAIASVHSSSLSVQQDIEPLSGIAARDPAIAF